MMYISSSYLIDACELNAAAKGCEILSVFKLSSFL